MKHMTYTFVTVVALFLTACSSLHVIDLTKENFFEAEKKTLRVPFGLITAGPLEGVPEVVAKDIAGKFTSGECKEKVRIRIIENTFSRDTASYTCE